MPALHVKIIHVYFVSFYYAPNFEEVEGANWFGPVRACVRVCVTLAYGHEPLEIWSWNFVCGISTKIKRTLIFFFRRTCRSRVIALFRRFLDFPIVSKWNLVNKIPLEPLELGPWYLAHRLCPRCRWPDDLIWLYSLNIWLNYLPFPTLSFCVVKQQNMWRTAWARIMISGLQFGYMM